MDDIPVKIIEKYKPPKKIALPSVLQHKPTSTALKYHVIIAKFFVFIIFILVVKSSINLKCNHFCSSMILV